jgi:uncharacterized membrane protein
MQRKYGLLLAGFFLMALVAYAGTVFAYRDGFLDRTSAEIITYSLLPFLFLSFLFGIGSVVLSLAVRAFENDFVFMEEFRINPIKYVVWAEVREDVIRKHEARRRERSTSEPGL